MAPSRGFDGQLFFVYDREAVTKEGDPPEDAIIYFYPPSASIESRISICGQLVGVSNFLTTVLDFAPVLIKLNTEKVALLQSGKYTLAMGGSSTEPESLLLRQLNALFSVFAFYHGSFDNIEKFSKDHESFLCNMTIIWDCYLPFIRYYGDTLPAVFDPLPFLKTPKNSSGSFLKASHILQACQRRRHVLGGCILYKKSVLCTHLEPCITRRLLLFQPNQSHHPARPIKTDINLPFGVRILHSFLATHEYKRLMKELSRSPYHQKPSSQPIESSVFAEDEQGKELNKTVGERFNGLLHKSVRKRIESESQEASGARENNSKAKSTKIVRPKARERIKGRSMTTLVRGGGPPSPLKHESSHNKIKSRQKKNGIIHSNELHIELPPKQHQDSETTDNAPKECGIKHNKHSPVKLVNELPFGIVNTDKDADGNTVRDQFSSTSLKNYQESGSLEDDTLYPISSSRTDSKQDNYHYSSGSSDEEELTMDEVDVKDLKIVSYTDKDGSLSCDEAGSVFKISSSESVVEICNELVHDLIEEVFKISDKTCEISLNGNSVHTLSHDSFPSSSVSSQLCEGQNSETNLQVNIPNGHQDQPDSLGLNTEEPINGHVCEYNECDSWTLGGRHNGVLTISTGENGYSNKKDLETASNKAPIAAAEAVTSPADLGCSTPAMEQNGHREKSESITTSTSGEENRIGTQSNLCGNPVGILTDSFPDMSVTDPNDATSQKPKEFSLNCSSEVEHDDASSKECGSPGSDYHDSLEDLVTDCGKSDEKFLEESSSNLLQDYKSLKKNDIMINKYSSRNIDLPKDKNLEKSFFKHLVGGRKYSDKSLPSSETKTKDFKHGESNPESSDSEKNACAKDSRTSSELSEYDTTSIDSFTRGSSGDCKSSLGDSGLCLSHEGSDNVSHGETEVDSNPGIPQDQHGNDVNASELVDGATNFSSEEQLAEPNMQDNGDEDDRKEEVDCDEEMDDNAFKVDGLVHLNLYVQAHSNTVLILLAEDQLHQDNETIKALWKTSLNELGELEVRLNQCHENLDHSLKPEDYSYLVYDGLSNTTKGNLDEPVLQADHMFCDTAKTVHEQFNNCSSLRSVTLRNSSSAVYCQRSLGQEVYFHKKGSYKSFLSSPSPRDPAFTLEKRACKLLHKDQGINMF